MYSSNFNILSSLFSAVMDPIFQLMEMVNPKEDTFENVGYFISGKVNPKVTTKHPL